MTFKAIIELSVALLVCGFILELVFVFSLSAVAHIVINYWFKKREEYVKNMEELAHREHEFSHVN